MRSSLSGDFSRIVFDRRKHYSAVQMQQGRVQLDADWNAQGEIAAHRLETLATDLIGGSGAPFDHAGFRLAPLFALRFDGTDDHVRIPEPPPPGPAGFTLTAWVTPRAGGAGGAVVSRFGQTPGGGRDACLLAVDPQGRVVFRQSGSPAAELRTGCALPFGRASHVAVTFDGARTVLYVDGLPAAAASQGRHLAPLAAAFLIGATLLDRKLHLPFGGLIRDVRMFREALTAEAVRREPFRQPAAAEPGLLAWWPLDDSGPAGEAGDTVADRSGNGHHGALGKGASRPERALADLAIGAGRYYVRGVLCENEDEVLFTRQPDLPGAVLPAAPGLYLAYLDVWERFVTPVEDPDLREVALGGPGTTTRSRTLAQVKLLALREDGELETADLEALLAARRPQGRLNARRQLPPATTLGNLLYRVEIQAGGGAYGWPRPAPDGGSAETRVAALDAGAGNVTLDPPGAAAGWSAGDCAELWSDQTDAGGQPGLAAPVTAVDPGAGTLTLNAALSLLAGHTGLRLRPLATFRWSRDNGSLVFPIRGVTGADVTVQHPPGGPLELRAGTWVELADDETVLAGRPTPLFQVASVDPDLSEVTLRPAPPPGTGADPSLHPLLRVWNQTAAIGGLAGGGTGPAGGEAGRLYGGAQLVVAGDWLDLEDNIQVSFEAHGSYRTGDFWWLPARTLTETIEWPADAAGEPLPQPPAGIEHRCAPLALVRLDQSAVQDRRRTFQPMVEGAVSKAGDTMYGSLMIQADLCVKGEARAEVLVGRLGSRDAVGSEQIRPEAVTADKLAPDVGIVPPGYSILGGTPEPPPGYAGTGAFLAFQNADPRWRFLGMLARDNAGAIAAVVVGSRIFALLETGEVWELDPAGGAPAVRTRLPQPRRAFAAAAVGGKIYVVGGIDPSGGKLARTEEYDPAADRWTLRADMPTARDSLALAAISGRLYALGGRRAGTAGDRVTAANEEYDPATDSWEARKPLPSARYGLAAAPLAGGVHAVGGEKDVLRIGKSITGAHEEYRPTADVWRRRAPLLYARRGLGLAALEGRLYAVGGEGPLGGGNSNQQYDPANATWDEGAPLPVPASAPGVAAAAGSLYVVGGRRGPHAGAVPLHQLAVCSILYVYRKLAPGESPAPEPDDDAFDF